MNSIEYLESFLKKHIQDYDMVIETKPSITGNAVLYRASIDKVTGGNFATSGYEFSLTDALNELVAEIKTELVSLDIENKQKADAAKKLVKK